MGPKLFVIQILAIFLIPGVIGNGPDAGSAPTSIPANKYPDPTRDECVQDTYGDNVVIKDPYRWMEKPSPKVDKFIEEEMALTVPYLKSSPFRAELEARYKELYDHPKYQGPIPAGKKFFTLQNSGLQNQNVLYEHDCWTDKGKVFIDFNTFSADGSVALELYASAFSHDGNIFAYATSVNGSEWMTIQFKHVDSKCDIYKEKLKAKYSAFTWMKDDKSGFYAKGSEKGVDDNANCKLFYHVLGTDPSKDIVAAEFPKNPNYIVGTNLSDCGKFLIVYLFENAANLIYIVDLSKINYEIKGKLELKPIITKMEANYYFVANNENNFIFISEAVDNKKLITIDITNPDPKSWKDLVPENDKDRLEWVYPAHDKYLVLCYTQNVKSVLQLHDITTGKMIKKFDLEIGTVDTAYCNRKSPHLFFSFKSFLTPGIAYHCDLNKPSFDLEVVNEIKLKNFCRDNFVVKQEYYPSKDGTKIPMYIVHKKDLKLDGKNPGFMCAYGAGSYSLTPYFTVNRLVVIGNFNGVHAVPNIRGGGEFGELWHKAGSLDKKQNSFDDFIAAVEYLVTNKYIDSKLLGFNAQGLLVAACVNQRPDLFGAAIASSGLYDMLRYDKVSDDSSGVSEYGSSKNPKDFQVLIGYSPLHNIKIPKEPCKQYPPLMLTSSPNDDMVFHTLKFIAELQFQAKKHPNQKNPFILLMQNSAAVSADYGLSTDEVLTDFVDTMSFIVINTGIKYTPCT